MNCIPLPTRLPAWVNELPCNAELSTKELSQIFNINPNVIHARSRKGTFPAADKQRGSMFSEHPKLINYWKVTTIRRFIRECNVK